MIYLISKVVIWLALAFLLGAVLGWWLRRIKANEAQAAYVAELENLSLQNADLNLEKASLTEGLAERTQALASTEEALAAKEQELLTQTNEMLTLQRQLSESQERIAEQEEETTQLAGQLELQRASLTELQTRADALTAKRQQAADQWLLERSVLEDKLAITDKDLAALTASAGARQRQWVEEQQQLVSEHSSQQQKLQAELQKAQSGADQGVKKLQAKVEGLQQQHVLLQRQHTEQLESAQSLDKSNSRLSTKVAHLLEELGVEKTSAEQRDAQLQSQVDELQQRLSKTQELAEERQRELDANNESLSSNESQVARLTQDVRRWRQRIPDLQSELDEKEALLRERDSRLASLQEQLDNRVSRLQASQRALIANSSNALPDQQKDARIAQLRAQLERLRPAVSGPDKVQNRVDDSISVSDSRVSDRPRGFLTSRPSQVDDLQRIKGIGPKLEGLLHELGIYQFQQIAALSRSDVAWLDDYLNFKGRIDRDDWIGQAESLTALG